MCESKQGEREVGVFFFFFQAEDGIRDYDVTGVQTCALPICPLRGARHHAHHGTAPLQQPSCPGRVAPFPDLGTRPTLRHSPTSMRFRLLAAQFLVNSIPYRRLGRSAFRRARRSLLRLRAS